MTEVPITYYCMDCSLTVDGEHATRCSRCGGVITYKRADDSYKIRKGEFDVDKYWDFLPLEDPKKLMGTGNKPTQLVESKKLTSVDSSTRVFLKDETQTNTHSSKDRMAVVALSQLNEQGIKSFVVCSTGNVASALGYLLENHPEIQMHCFVAEDFLSRYRYVDSPNIIMHKLEPGYDSAQTQALQFAKEQHVHHDGGYFSTAKRAGLGMAFLEAWEQAKTDFDYYFQAVSSGMGVLGVYEMAEKMKKAGMIDRIPSLVAVQQDTCDPMVKAFEAGVKEMKPEHIVKHPTGIAKAILTGDPTVCYPSMYKVVTETHGSFVSVSEAEIRSAQAHLNNKELIKATPDGAVALAGFLKYAETHADELKNKNVLINITG